MKRFADLQRGECQWPIGDLFCGCQTGSRHRVYCDEHAARAHRATPSISDDKQRQIADALTGVKEKKRYVEGHGGHKSVDRLQDFEGIKIGMRLELQSLHARRGMW